MPTWKAVWCKDSLTDEDFLSGADPWLGGGVWRGGRQTARSLRWASRLVRRREVKDIRTVCPRGRLAELNDQPPRNRKHCPRPLPLPLSDEDSPKNDLGTRPTSLGVVTTPRGPHPAGSSAASPGRESQGEDAGQREREGQVPSYKV